MKITILNSSTKLRNCATVTVVAVTMASNKHVASKFSRYRKVFDDVGSSKVSCIVRRQGLVYSLFQFRSLLIVFTPVKNKKFRMGFVKYFQHEFICLIWQCFCVIGNIPEGVGHMYFPERDTDMVAVCMAHFHNILVFLLGTHSSSDRPTTTVALVSVDIRNIPVNNGH